MTRKILTQINHSRRCNSSHHTHRNKHIGTELYYHIRTVAMQTCDEFASHRRYAVSEKSSTLKLSSLPTCFAGSVTNRQIRHVNTSRIEEYGREDGTKASVAISRIECSRRTHHIFSSPHNKLSTSKPFKSRPFPSSLLHFSLALPGFPSRSTRAITNISGLIRYRHRR